MQALALNVSSLKTPFVKSLHHKQRYKAGNLIFGLPLEKPSRSLRFSPRISGPWFFFPFNEMELGCCQDWWFGKSTACPRSAKKNLKSWEYLKPTGSILSWHGKISDLRLEVEGLFVLYNVVMDMKMINAFPGENNPQNKTTISLFYSILQGGFFHFFFKGNNKHRIKC